VCKLLGVEGLLSDKEAVLHAQVTTYGILAKVLRSSPRAVGQVRPSRRKLHLLHCKARTLERSAVAGFEA
jgi:hypothetical protein